MEIVPDFTARQFRVCDAWIFWIWAMVALLTRPARAVASRVRAPPCRDRLFDVCVRDRLLPSGGQGF
jgi:hypothetical protein